MMLHVRKHPAPEGALRPLAPRSAGHHCRRQKAPSTRRCIKTPISRAMPRAASRSEDTQTRRCIKTQPVESPKTVRSHQKALNTRRRIKTMRQWRTRRPGPQVRKHSAPEGALSREGAVSRDVENVRQKAPSTRRCIKTLFILTRTLYFFSQKAPSTTRCIKTESNHPCDHPGGSVRKHQHQKVH